MGIGIDLPVLAGVDRGPPAVGMLDHFQAPGIDLRRVIRSAALDLRPAVGGRAVVQALDLNSDIDSADSPVSDGPIATTIARRPAELLLSDHSGQHELALRAGFRSLPADGHTIAGSAAPHSRIHCLVSHSGIALAPVLGRLGASEVSTDQDQDLRNAFRPSRFAGRERSEFEGDQHATRLGEQ